MFPFGKGGKPPKNTGDDDDDTRRIYDPEEQKMYEELFRAVISDEIAMVFAKQAFPNPKSAKFRDYMLWDEGRLNLFIEAEDQNGNITVIQAMV